VLGLTPLQAGLWTLPWSGGFIVGSLLTPLAARHIRPVRLIIGGLAVGAAGFAILGRLGEAGGSALSFLVAGSLLFSLGLSPVFTLANDMILAAAPPDRAGAAAGISETSAELGGALGIAIMGSVGAAVYRARIADAVPAGIPLETAAAARGTLGGAVAAAAKLPGSAGESLLGAARDAFTHALAATAWFSVAVVLAMAVVAAVWLRGATSGT
jgi:DHA2 family multidrug resistance protein-like MFS transporter